MGKVVERIVNAERVEDLITVFGSFDENIKRIEETLNVRVVNRGTDLRVSGDEEMADKAVRTLEGLLSLAAKGETIDEQRVRYLITLVNEGNDAQVAQMAKDVVCITAKGKPIKAKTVGQQNYMKAIMKNTITIGVGPAGTGKTYLAVAAEFSLPLPALLASAPKVAAIAELIVFGAAAVLSFDIILKGFHALKEHLFTLHTLGSISILLTLADAIVYCFIGRAGSAPYSAPGTLLLLCLTWGYYDKQVANYRACRQAAYAATPYRITKDEKLWNSRDTFTKEPGDSHGFGSQLQAPTEADLFQSRTAPILLLAALLLAFLASVGRGRPESFLWCAAVMSLSVCPLSALLGYGQPWLRLTRRMEKNGCAVAGWPGVKAAAGPGGVLISDTDLFPSGTIQFNGIKVYGDISLEKLAGCAASLIRTSGSCLTDLFDGLVRTQGGFYRKVEDFQCYEAGGLSGSMRGEQVMVGTASFMKVMDVPLPQDLKVNNAIFCAIDGSLRGIFALNYAKTASVRPAVSALLHTKLVPVLAPRDFNITPAMVRQKLKVPVERMEYPPVERRLELTEPGQEHSETLCALLNRDTVEAYSAAIVGCRRLRAAVRSNCILSLIASLVGLVLGYYLTTMQAFASLTPGNVLIFLALWLIPTLLVNGNVNRY